MMERKNGRRSGRKNETATESSGVDEMKRKKENASAREKSASGKESASGNGIESAEIGSSRGRRNDPRAGLALETGRLRARGKQ